MFEDDLKLLVERKLDEGERNFSHDCWPEAFIKATDTFDGVDLSDTERKKKRERERFERMLREIVIRKLTS